MRRCTSMSSRGAQCRENPIHRVIPSGARNLRFYYERHKRRLPRQEARNDTLPDLPRHNVPRNDTLPDLPRHKAPRNDRVRLLWSIVSFRAERGISAFIARDISGDCHAKRLAMTRFPTCHGTTCLAMTGSDCSNPSCHSERSEESPILFRET